MSINYTAGNNGNPAILATRSYDRTIGLPYVVGNGMVRDIAENIAISIIEDARTVHGPVVWVTGNSYMPPFRSFDMAEHVWNAENNEDGELFEFLVELVEDRLRVAEVALECPDYDNALYAVDLKRWQWKSDTGDDLNDDWEPRTP